jgi:hypothetical protein
MGAVIGKRSVGTLGGEKGGDEGAGAGAN